MFHLLAYSQSINSAAETDTLPVSDDIFVIQNNHFLPQQDMFGLWGTAFGTNLTRARLITPSMRQVTPPEIRPIVPALIGGSRNRVARWLRNPPLFRAVEEIELATTNNAGAAQQISGLLALAPSLPSPAVQGPMYVMRGTGTTTVTANKWTTCPITWSDILPNGTYAVVGLSGFSTNGQALRLIFIGQTWRPGALCQTVAGDIEDPLFQDGSLGEYGRFNTTTLPNVQFLCNGADTAQTVYLYLVRVG